MAIKAGLTYYLRPSGGHGTWIVRVHKVSVTTIEVSVIKGQHRGKSSRFRFARRVFEHTAIPTNKE